MLKPKPMSQILSILVDARGLRCPLPVLRLTAAARDMPTGSRIELLADDPAAQTDVPAFVGERGWTGVEIEIAPNGTTRFWVTR